MKKLVLFSLFAITASFSMFGLHEGPSHSIQMDAQGNAYVIHDYAVQEDTFNFIQDFSTLLLYRCTASQRRQDDPVWAFTFANYDFQKMEPDLSRVGQGFNQFRYQEYQELDDYWSQAAYIENTVIKPSIAQDAIFIAGNRKIQITDGLQINNGSIIPSEVDPKAVAFIYPILKASSAATATGVVTYCALRFYNKDKAKEQQYSPIKWSLGAAAVVGAGTYWYVR